MYLSKQPDDQRPRALMRYGGRFADKAVVAAPIRNLCPANPLESRPPLLIRSLVSLFNFSRVNRGPEAKDKGLELKYATIAEIGPRAN